MGKLVIEAGEIFSRVYMKSLHPVDSTKGESTSMEYWINYDDFVKEITRLRDMINPDDHQGFPRDRNNEGMITSYNVVLELVRRAKDEM
jgi:hypothetical protein